MTSSLTYLDHAATTPLCASVKAAMVEAMELLGNPSSIHRAGRAARDAVESARQHVAAAVKVSPAQVIFTSGGTEANAMALTMRPQDARFCSAVEHSAVRDWVRTENFLPVSSSGRLNLDNIPDDALISCMLVNNETGVIQPVSELVAAGRLLHCDAVQALGKTKVDFAALGVDMLSISAHKIGGPKGVGALIVRDGLVVKPRQIGGGQERRRRPGTENLLGLIGFGAAAETLNEYLNAYDAVTELRQRLIASLPGAIVYGGDADHVPHIVSLRMPGVQNQLQLMRFDLAGICVSAGSACSSGKVTPSHVLEAMGVPARDVLETIRVSLGPTTTAQDIDHFISVWNDIAASQKDAA